MKNKSGPVTAKALEEVFKDGAVPYVIRSDLGKKKHIFKPIFHGILLGTEFFNSHVKAVLDKYEIKQYKALNRTKASFSERLLNY